MCRALSATSVAMSAFVAGSVTAATRAENRSTHARIPYAWRAKTFPSRSRRASTPASSATFSSAIRASRLLSETRVYRSVTILQRNPGGQRVGDPAQAPGLVDEASERAVFDGGFGVHDEALVAQLVAGAVGADDDR